MDSSYFAHTLTLYELDAFLRGLQRRRQQAWEVARYVSYHAAAPHCKNFRFEDMGKFPWEKDAEAPAMSEEEQLCEIKRLRALAAERDKELLQRKEDGER